MPWIFKFVGRWGNAAAALVFALGFFGTIFEERPGMSVILVALTALAVFNMYTIAKSARILAEEEWLEAELRKAQLREKLAS